MSPDANPVVPETLLAHTGWMRRLARTLVRDDSQADDVVQDAVVAAMRSPPRDAVALPAWLASTVKNGARQLWRGESRRTARESAAARPEAAPGAAEVVARAEEHGIVVQAVLALEEPYRSALLLRFYDDLPPRDVAARLGVPLETARARIRRGVEKLRERLDQRHGGDGNAWRLALMPLVLHKTAAAAAAGTATGAAAGHQLTTGAMIMAGTGTVATVGGLALVVGIASGWWFGATTSDAVAAKHLQTIDETKKELQAATQHASGADENLKRQTAKLSELDSTYRAAAKESDELKGLLKTAQGEIADLKSEIAALKAGPAPAPNGPRFPFSQFGKLNDVDWKGVGEHLSAISPICAEISAAIAKGEDYTALQGKAAQHNGYLINAAVKILGQVPGTGVNGSFTHPAFQANAIAAALDAAGKPLTPEQATAFEKLARESSDEDARRLQGYTDATYALQKVLDEADLRGRFFTAAFAVLTEDQRNTLTPPGTKGRIGLDLYSEGLLWATVIRPISFKEKDADALTSDVLNALNSRLKLPTDQQDAARGVVGTWAHDLPASLVTAARDGEDGMTVTTVRLAATQTLAILQGLVADLKLDGKPADAARKWPAVLLPSPQKND
jgi:RNA polymerase sigma-70 factor (ECF subfamily)